MKSCCSNCKEKKPCCSRPQASPLNGLFRSIGYGVYGDGAVTAPTVAPELPAPSTLVDSVSKWVDEHRTLSYIIGAYLVYKVLL